MSDDRALLPMVLRSSRRLEIAASRQLATSPPAMPLTTAQNVVFSPPARTEPALLLPPTAKIPPLPAVRSHWDQEISQVTNMVPRLEVNQRRHVAPLPAAAGMISKYLSEATPPKHPRLLLTSPPPLQCEQFLSCLARHHHVWCIIEDDGGDFVSGFDPDGQPLEQMPGDTKGLRIYILGGERESHQLDPLVLHLGEHGATNVEMARAVAGDPVGRNRLLASIRAMSATDITPQTMAEAESDEESTWSKSQRVDDRHLRNWLAMTKEQRGKQTIVGYARRHQLSLNSFKHLASLDGLRLMGEQQLDPSLVKNEISSGHIQAWRNLGEEGRRQTGREGYAREHELSARRWLRTVKLEGDGLLPSATFRLEDNQTLPIEAHHLEEWLTTKREERKKQGVANFASRHNLNVNSWQKLANLEGLTELGWQRHTQPLTVKITNEHRQQWLDMDRQTREQQGIAGYALANNLNVNSWKDQANLNGLSAKGQSAMNVGETTPITHQHLSEWLERVKMADNVMTPTDYARHNNLNLSTWSALANKAGLTRLGHNHLNISQVKYQVIQRKDLQVWKEMSAGERQRWDSVSYASQHNFNPHSWRKYANDSGLTAIGENYLSQTIHLAIEDYHLEKWRKLTLQAEKNPDMLQFAAENNISINTLRSYANSEGLKAAGEKRLSRDKHHYSVITGDHLAAWQKMDRQQRKHSNYVEKHNLNPARWRLLATLDGLTVVGQQTLHPESTHAPTRDELQQWQDMSQQERDRLGGTRGFAARHQITLRSFNNLAKKDGLQPLGEARLAAPMNPHEITAAHLSEWRRMTQGKKMDISASLAYCTTQGFNPDSWLTMASTQGLTPKGIKRLNQQPGISGKNRKQGVKIEQQTSYAVADDIASWQPQYNRLHLSVRKNAPLLVDLHSGKSATAAVLGHPQSIKLSGIELALPQINKKQRKRVAETLLKQAQDIVRSDGENLANLYQKLKMTFDEENKEMGMGLVAADDFSAGELIGPYCGAFIKNDDELNEACKKVGGQNVLTYLWGTKSDKGYISAYHNPAPTAVANTGDMNRHPSSANNNAAAIFINDILPVYIATRQINKGDAILIDYGQFYAPDGIKQDTLNNDIVRIIAREKSVYFTIKNQSGLICFIFGPEGEIKSMPSKTIKTYKLQQRLNERGIYQYDVLTAGKAGRITIPDGENNLYHAIAKALYPSSKENVITAKITEIKEKVAEVYRLSETIIKTEPVEEPMDE